MGLKKLGSSSPAANVETDLYVIPNGTQAVISSIFVCNRGNTVALFNISHTVGGGPTQNSDYLYFQLEISPYDTFVVTAGITAFGNDVIRVESNSSNLSFNIYGEEV
jgi:hypothetical protein